MCPIKSYYEVQCAEKNGWEMNNYSSFDYTFTYEQSVKTYFIVLNIQYQSVGAVYEVATKKSTHKERVII